MNKAIFLDRDGTINIDSGYIGNPNLLKLYPGVAKGISRLKKKFGFNIIVISNQSGISRGLITSDDVDKVNNRINEILAEDNAEIDAFYYCPYHPDFDSPEKCKCRKPSPKMVYEAADDFNIDLSKSFMIGDKLSDIYCGQNAGVESILLTTTISDVELNELKNSQNSPKFITDNFLSAIEYIERNIDGEILET
jgi:D,D-heptose 1,7-bisphosphate phosphatase